MKVSASIRETASLVDLMKRSTYLRGDPDVAIKTPHGSQT